LKLSLIPCASFPGQAVEWQTMPVGGMVLVLGQLSESVVGL